MSAVRKDEVFVTSNLACSESSRESAHQASPGAKPSFQDLFSLGPQKGNSVYRTESQVKVIQMGTTYT